MATNNRTCIVCGRKYRYCGNCSDNDKMGETWRNIYCSDNCSKIFDLLSKASFGYISKPNAGEALSKLNLERLDDFRADIKAQAKELIAASKNNTEQKINNKKESDGDNHQSKEIVKDRFKR